MRRWIAFMGPLLAICLDQKDCTALPGRVRCTYHAGLWPLGQDKGIRTPGQPQLATVVSEIGGFPLRLRGGRNGEPGDHDTVSEYDVEDDPVDQTVIEGLEKLRVAPREDEASQRSGDPGEDRSDFLVSSMEERLASDAKTIVEASKQIADLSENLISEMDEGRSSHSSDLKEEQIGPREEQIELPSYAPSEDLITEYQAGIFRKFRTQLDQVMKDFEMEPFDEMQLDPKDQAELDEQRAELEELTEWERKFNHTLTASSKLWGGDNGQQLVRPEDEEPSPHPLLVDSADPSGFQTVSAAVNSSYRGQTVAIAPGEHEVGDTLMWMGLDDDCLPECYPSTLHLQPGWHVNFEGLNEASVLGMWWLGDETAGQFERLSLSWRAHPGDSQVLSCLGHDVGDLPQYSRAWVEPRPEEKEEEEEEEREGVEAAMAGVVLVEVLGAWSMADCCLSLNGGICVQLQEAATLQLKSCRLGGVGPANHSLQEAEMSAEAVTALQDLLNSAREPRAAAGVMALNRSKVGMQACELAHVWNGGATLHHRSSAHIASSSFLDCGYAVGVDDAASAVVQRCRVELGAAGLLDQGAFYAGESSAQAAMQLSHNSVTGKLWLGGRRPGRRLVERANSGDGPAEGDDGRTVEEGREREAIESMMRETEDLQQIVDRQLQAIAAAAQARPGAEAAATATPWRQ